MQPYHNTRRDTFTTISFLRNIFRSIRHLFLPHPPLCAQRYTCTSTHYKLTKQENPSAETRTVEGAVQNPHAVPPYQLSTYRYEFFV